MRFLDFLHTSSSSVIARQIDSRSMMYLLFRSRRWSVFVATTFCTHEIKLHTSLASKLLADVLENFLRMCPEVTICLATAASKTLFSSYRTGNTFELSILNDITPFSNCSYINLGLTVCLRELLKYASGFKLLETLPGMSIPRRIHARKAE